MPSLGARIADRFVLRPTTDPIPLVGENANVHRTEIPWCGGKVELLVRQRTGQTSDSAIPYWRFLKLPGVGGRAERSSSFPGNFLPLGSSYEIATWNPPGYGGSTPPATLAEIPIALLELWDHRYGKNNSNNSYTVVIGNSLGASLALYLAAHRNVSALIVRNPPPLAKLVRSRNAWWNFYCGGSWLCKYIPSAYNTDLTAENISCPTIWITSAQDTLVPASMQESSYRAIPAAKQQILLSPSQHDTPMTDQHLLQFESAFKWLTQNLAQNSTAVFGGKPAS